MENLLDIDFDGTAPASAQKEPPSGMSGLEGLAGTPMRVGSPSTPTTAQAASSNNLEDLMGVFGNGSTSAAAVDSQAGNNGGTAGADLLNGLAGLDVSGASTSTPPTGDAQSPQKKTNADIMDLF